MAPILLKILEQVAEMAEREENAGHREENEVK
jgi:hypothetical protein